MMKVSDPIIFGHCVRVFFENVFAEHGGVLDELGVDANNGFGDVVAKIAELPVEERAAIEADIRAAYADGPGIAMVNSDMGITNLHVPSDIIIDASMPPMIRDSGGMWNAQGELQDCKAVIPDSSYAGIYDAVVRDCQQHGQLDPSTMGSVPNVDLMAQKAEEYGSHDNTFEVPSDGTVRVMDAGGDTLIEQTVEAGDIWRACQTKDAPLRDWVKLAVKRARATGSPAVFWLDSARAHDVFETGAGGSAPKHVQQFELEGHLRWDSLGEYMALGASLQHLGDQFDNAGARVLGDALDTATARYLENARAPSRRVHELDNRGSAFYLTLYWAQALAEQQSDVELAERFGPVASALAQEEEKILSELNGAQGLPQDVGGYYLPDQDRVAAAMRPSATLKAIIDGV